MLITVASFPWRLTHNEHNILGVSPAFVLITNVTRLAVIFFWKSQACQVIIVKRRSSLAEADRMHENIGANCHLCLIWQV